MHAGRAAIDMKHETYKTVFQFEGLGQSPLGGLRGGGGGGGGKHFQNMVMLHIKLKLMTLAATW